MAASTISRSVMTDGVGGTTVNNAWLISFIYDKIDALFTAAFTFGDTITAEGFGTHTFSAGDTGYNTILVRNTSAGSGNGAAIHLGHESDADMGRIELLSGSFTSSGSRQANGLTITSDGAGGVNIAAENASGAVTMYAAGTTKTATYDGDTMALASATAGAYAMAGVLSSSINDTSTGTDANVDQKDLHTFSLPAGTLASDGQGIRYSTWGTFAANGSTKTVRIYFGSTVVANISGAHNATTWRADMEVYRTGATAQKAVCTIWNGIDGTAGGNLVQNDDTPAETLSGAVTVKVTGQNGTATANDIVCLFSKVTFLP